MDAACAVQLQRRTDAAKAHHQHERQAHGGHDAQAGHLAQAVGRQQQPHGRDGHAQAPALERRPHHLQEAVRVGAAWGHVHVLLAPAPEDQRGQGHQQSRQPESQARAELLEDDGHQQRREEAAEVDDPVEGVVDLLRQRPIALVELVADEAGHQRLDAARAQRDQEQAEVKALDVVLEHGQAGMAGTVDEAEPEDGVVLAEEAVSEPAAQQWEEIDADDEGVEHLLGLGLAHVLGNGQQQAGHQEDRQDVAHAVEAEALASFVADDVGNLRRHLGRGGRGGRCGRHEGLVWALKMRTPPGLWPSGVPWGWISRAGSCLERQLHLAQILAGFHEHQRALVNHGDHGGAPGRAGPVPALRRWRPGRRQSCRRRS